MRTNHQPNIAVLADDLTSAADGAAPFVARGLTASIGRGQLPRQAAAVVAVDSGSRSATSSQAFERVARLTDRLASRAVLYKTVDSTLRGHIAEELEACFAASGRKSLVFAPAFPQAGRTTVGGIQLVDGIPVSESAYGHDPVHPARHSALGRLGPELHQECHAARCGNAGRTRLADCFHRGSRVDPVGWLSWDGCSPVAAFCAGEDPTAIDRWHQQRCLGRHWERESAQSSYRPINSRRSAASCCCAGQGRASGTRPRCCAASHKTQRESFKAHASAL